MGCNCSNQKTIKEKIMHIKKVVTEDIKDLWDSTSDSRLVKKSKNAFVIKK